MSCTLFVCVACAQVYHDMLDAARGIVRDKGFMGLYAGLGVTLIEIMPYAALQFGLYDGLQGVWRRAKVRARDNELPTQQQSAAPTSSRVES